MTRSRGIVGIAVALALVLAPVANAASEDVSPTASEENGGYMLENDRLMVKFAGKAPVLEVYAAGEDAPAFTHAFLRVVEFTPGDEDASAYEGTERAVLDLRDAEGWSVNTTRDGGVVTLAFDLHAPVTMKGPLDDTGLIPDDSNVTPPTSGEANVTLAFHLRDDAGHLPMTDAASLAVPASAFTFTFTVHEWPWSNAEENRLALETVTDGDLTREPFLDLPGAVVDRDGDARGVLAWSDTAQGVTSEDVATDARVHAAENGTENGTRVAFTYDAQDLATVEHGGVIGLASAAEDATDGVSDVAERLRDVPGPGALLAMAGVAAAAVAGAGRHRFAR